MKLYTLPELAKELNVDQLKALHIIYLEKKWHTIITSGGLRVMKITTNELKSKFK